MYTIHCYNEVWLLVVLALQEQHTPKRSFKHRLAHISHKPLEQGIMELECNIEATIIVQFRYQVINLQWLISLLIYTAIYNQSKLERNIIHFNNNILSWLVIMTTKAERSPGFPCSF